MKPDLVALVCFESLTRRGVTLITDSNDKRDVFAEVVDNALAQRIVRCVNALRGVPLGEEFTYRLKCEADTAILAKVSRVREALKQYEHWNNKCVSYYVNPSVNREYYYVCENRANAMQELRAARADLERV